MHVIYYGLIGSLPYCYKMRQPELRLSIIEVIMEPLL
jgi:hypothetical protein